MAMNSKMIKKIIASAPCIGCILECDPKTCKKIYDWLMTNGNKIYW